MGKTTNTLALPRFPAPGDRYEVQNEAQFRREVERNYQDMISYMGRIALDPATLSDHVLATNVALGAQHTASGLTNREVLIASAATAANFRLLVAADLPTHTHAAADVTSGMFVDARIAASNVTQHQAALTILETQITDGSLLARVASTETISGLWTFSNAGGLKTDIIAERTGAAGVTIDGLLIKDSGIPQAAVTAHEAALTILEPQITDGSLLARLADAETVSGIWTFTASTLFGTGTTADGQVHIQTGAGAGTVTASALADELVLEGSGSTGLSILTNDSSEGFVIFGSPADNDAGQLRYTPITNRFLFLAGGGTQMIVVSGHVELPNGSAAAPAWTFINSTTVGMFLPGGNVDLAFSVDTGVEALRILANKDLKTFGSLLLNANDGGALGVSGTAWSDLFLASGAVINFNAGDVTITHSTNLVTIAGGDVTISQKLLVSHDITNALIVRRTTSEQSSALFQNSTTGSTTTDGLEVGILGDESAVVWQYEQSDLKFATDNAERARIFALGDVRIGDGNALATTATDGFLLVPGCAGTPTGNPANDGVGAIAIVYDTTNNLLYANDGGGWVAVNSP